MKCSSNTLKSTVLTEAPPLLAKIIAPLTDDLEIRLHYNIVYKLNSLCDQYIFLLADNCFFSTDYASLVSL